MAKRRRRRRRWLWIALAVAVVSAAGVWLWRDGFASSKPEPPTAEPAPRGKPASPPHEEIRDGDRRALEKLLEEKSAGDPANLPR